MYSIGMNSRSSKFYSNTKVRLFEVCLAPGVNCPPRYTQTMAINGSHLKFCLQKCKINEEKVRHVSDGADYNHKA